jgi:hypothetical protein
MRIMVRLVRTSLHFLLLVLVGCSTDPFLTPDAAPLDASPDIGDVAVGDVSISDVAVDSGCQNMMTTCSAGAECTSFDVTNGNPLTPFIVEATSNGTVGITQTHAVSCPNGLAASLAPMAAVGDHAQIGADLPVGNTTFYHATLVTDVWLPANITGVYFLRLAAKTGSGVLFGVDSTGWYLMAEASGQRTAITTPIIGTWNHVVLQVVFSDVSTIGSVSFTYNTSNMMGYTTPLWNTQTSTSPTVSAYHADLGVFAMTPLTPAVGAYYDDVVFATP